MAEKHNFRTTLSTVLLGIGIVLIAAPLIALVAWVMYILVDAAAGGNYGSQPAGPNVPQCIAIGALSVIAGLGFVGISSLVDA